MKTKTIFKSILILCLVFSSISFFEQVLATVGGKTIVRDFRYDKEEKIAYFISEDMGVGGERTLYRYDLQEGKIEKVAGVGQIMTMFPDEEREKVALRYGCPLDDSLEHCVEDKRHEEFEKKEKELSLLKPLPRIDLRKNGIEIKVSAVSRKGLVPLWWGYSFVDYVATVIQNNQEKEQIKFTGCYWQEGYDSAEKKYIEPSKIELKANLDGFHIPGSDTVLFLISVERGICEEGGYLREKVFPITGIEITNQTPLPLREYEQCLKEQEQCGAKVQECYDRGGNYELCMEIREQCHQALEERGCRSLWMKAVPSTGGIFVDLILDTKNIPVVEGSVVEEEFQPINEQEPQEPATRESTSTKSSLLKLILLGVALIVILLAVILFRMKKPV